MLKTFPRLFKKNSTDGIEEWQIEVAQDEEMYPRILTRFGELNGKIQLGEDVIKEGKNLGKKNETSPLEQAIAEAQSKWEKKLKKGYVQSLEAAQAGEVDSIIEGGITPMTAQKWRDHSHKIKYPCAIQPKLDGVRCVAIKNGDEVTLWTRSRVKIESVPHINEAIKHYFCYAENVVFDGELYNHALKRDFESIISGVRTEEGNEKSALIQYHIYDLIDFKQDFKTRYQTLLSMMDGFDLDTDNYLHLVPTYEVDSREQVDKASSEFIEEMYEGSMVRNWNSLYVSKRSYDLQKIKDIVEDDFKIVGVEEGRGKLAGLVGAFVCETEKGIQFRCSPPGNQQATRKFVEDPKIIIGKIMTIYYMGYGVHGRPRIPKPKAIRDYE